MGPYLGLTAGRQKLMQVNLEFKKNSLYIKSLDFSLHLTKVQHHYSSNNAFQVVFSVKICCKVVFKVQKITEPYDFLPIPTY